jgi:hypothetical protein
MRYRQQDAAGDYVFMGRSPFLIDSSEAVVQAIKTRLTLFVKDWFVDLREGVDLSKILGYHTQNTRDLELKKRILGTKGVTMLVSYTSEVTSSRSFIVRATVNTSYGQVTFTQDYQL